MRLTFMNIKRLVNKGIIYTLIYQPLYSYFYFLSSSPLGTGGSSFNHFFDYLQRIFNFEQYLFICESNYFKT